MIRKSGIRFIILLIIEAQQDKNKLSAYYALKVINVDGLSQEESATVPGCRIPIKNQ